MLTHGLTITTYDLHLLDGSITPCFSLETMTTTAVDVYSNRAQPFFWGNELK